MPKSNFSMYRYFDGIGEYPNKKAAFFGFYEQTFENTYKGSPEEKAEIFNDYIMEVLYEQASNAYHFGEPSVDKDKCFEDYIRVYKEPEYKLETFN